MINKLWFIVALGTLAFLLAGAGLTAPAAASSPTTATSAVAAQGQPAQGSYQLSGETLRHAIAITRIRHTIALVDIAWGIITLWLFLALGFAAKIERFCEGSFHLRFFQGAFYYILLILILTVLELPITLFSFHVESHFGISVQSWSSWFRDQGISLALTLSVGVLLLLLFNWIVRKSPHRYWLWSWLIVGPLMIFTLVLSPYLAELYDKIEPLDQHHAELATKLEALVARTGTNIPRSRMYIALIGAKSNGLNAYVTGMGSTQRMVIWDTTATRLPDDEILFIMGHESGHYVLHHIPKMIVLDFFIVLIGFWLTAKFSEWLYAHYAAKWRVDGYSTRAGFTVLLLALSIVGQLISPAMNAVSRHFEHQADVYGQEAIHSLVPDPQQTAVHAFSALGAAWLEDPDPNPFFEFWFDNHPSVADRTKFAAHYNPWENGGHGQFFEK